MSSSANGWISFWEQNLLDDQQHHPDFTWSDPSAEDEALKVVLYQRDARTCSTENENSKGDSPIDNRRRARDDGSNGPQGKAGREKMRRDRMNDRFVELSAVLEPDKPPKTDKASILRDAARIINQLRVEAQHYKETNHQLQETIKELKVEKNELREEKLSLKAEKEILEKRLKTVHVFPGYAAHSSSPALPVAGASSSFMTQSHSLYAKPAGTLPPPAVPVAGVSSSSYTTQNHSLYNTPAGTSPYVSPNYTVLTKPPSSFADGQYSASMSQWIPAEIADVSNDHVLRPPVA